VHSSSLLERQLPHHRSNVPFDSNHVYDHFGSLVCRWRRTFGTMDGGPICALGEESMPSSFFGEVCINDCLVGLVEFVRGSRLRAAELVELALKVGGVPAGVMFLSSRLISLLRGLNEIGPPIPRCLVSESIR